MNNKAGTMIQPWPTIVKSAPQVSGANLADYQSAYAGCSNAA